jgi:phosphonate transport system substrate-binding protein
MNRRGVLGAAILAPFGLTATRAATAPLRVGLLPGESAPEVIRKHEPFRAALVAALRRPVHLTVAVDYSTTVEALRFGRLDIAFLGPASFVLLEARSKAEPFARPMRDGNATFEAAIIVPAGSPARGLRDLRGRNIAFGDIGSTGSHVAPRAMLLDAGLEAGRDYQARFLGAHDSVGLAVANGRAGAGGIGVSVLDRLVTRGTIDRNRIAVLATSAPLPEYTWTFSPGLAEGVRDEIRAAFLELRDPTALAPFRADRFVPSLAADYAPVATMMMRLGLLPRQERS